ncbi:hypothetical protein WN55_01747 [Dufourea novaeangliae]|uniref:Uncharacterized protein n=1 Tax=Dufourea novaeangliae TaxID=178035 RepID=A0A154PF00_DUFNO|nr:hypothetical protein WN55_01747 [Dufourea novaeangliae]
MRDEEVRSRITWMEVGDKIDSDHHPVVVTIRTGEEEKIGDTTRVGRRRKDWAEKGREIFRKETENMRIGMGGVEEEMKRGLEIMREAMETQGKEEGGKWRSRWWDQECKEKKKEARKEMRKWRKGKNEGKLNILESIFERDKNIRALAHLYIDVSSATGGIMFLVMPLARVCWAHLANGVVFPKDM